LAKPNNPISAGECGDTVTTRSPPGNAETKGLNDDVNPISAGECGDDPGKPDIRQEMQNPMIKTGSGKSEADPHETSSGRRKSPDEVMSYVARVRAAAERFGANPFNARDIETATGIHCSRALDCLAKLRDQGIVTRIGRGEYALNAEAQRINEAKPDTNPRPDEATPYADGAVGMTIKGVMEWVRSDGAKVRAERGYFYLGGNIKGFTPEELTAVANDWRKRKDLPPIRLLVTK